jgi:hypothetical protein
LKGLELWRCEFNKKSKVMKTEHSHYRNDALEALLKSFIEKIVGKVKLEAQRFGAINLPEKTGGCMSPFTEGDHLEFQQFIDKVHTDLPSNAISYQTAQQEKSTETQVKDLQNKAAAAKERQAETNIKVKNMAYPINITRLVLALLAVAGVCLFDGQSHRSCTRRLPIRWRSRRISTFFSSDCRTWKNDLAKKTNCNNSFNVDYYTVCLYGQRPSRISFRSGKGQCS